jgi:tetratricopeptide (TPR) repeat protein
MIYVLGALVLVGAVAAIAIALTNAPPDRPERTVSYGEIAAAQASNTASAANPTADSVAADCRRSQTDRNWTALAQCAAQLRSLDPKLAAELATRAAEETRSAPHVAPAQAALSDGALNQAKAEIDQVWPDSVDSAELQRAYAAAEAQEIDALATQLDSVKDASCAAYNQLLAEYSASDPPRVVQEATRRVSCKALPKCDADALAARARALFNKNNYTEALEAYDEAYKCRPAMTLLQDAFIVACTMGDRVEARSYWKQLSPALRAQSISACVTHNITESMLNTP